MITLEKAIKDGRLQEFIAQEDARGVGPIDLAELDVALSRVITQPRSKDQTSPSAVPDGLSETKTH